MNSGGERKSKKGKADYGTQNKQGIQLKHGKPKGEPENGRKQGELHELSNDRVNTSMAEMEKLTRRKEGRKNESG